MHHYLLVYFKKMTSMLLPDSEFANNKNVTSSCHLAYWDISMYARYERMQRKLKIHYIHNFFIEEQEPMTWFCYYFLCLSFNLIILFHVTKTKTDRQVNMFLNYFLFKFLNIKLLLLKVVLWTFNNTNIISVGPALDEIAVALGKIEE